MKESDWCLTLNEEPKRTTLQLACLYLQQLDALARLLLRTQPPLLDPLLEVFSHAVLLVRVFRWPHNGDRAVWFGTQFPGVFERCWYNVALGDAAVIVIVIVVGRGGESIASPSVRYERKVVRGPGIEPGHSVTSTAHHGGSPHAANTPRSAPRDGCANR